MTKADQTSTKITIDKRIVRVFEELPNTFTATELATMPHIPKKDLKSVVYDALNRIVKYGLVHKAKESSERYKEHGYKHREDKSKRKTKETVELDGFELLLLNYYKQIKSVKDD